MLTVGGALRARALEVLGGEPWNLGQRWWRDGAPEGATFPYVTFLDPTSEAPALSGDQQVLARRTLVTVDLWQRYKDESDPLLAALKAAVGGQRLTMRDADDAVVASFTTRLQGVVRVPDPDRTVVHHALTVAVAHRA